MSSTTEYPFFLFEFNTDNALHTLHCGYCSRVKFLFFVFCHVIRKIPLHKQKRKIFTDYIFNGVKEEVYLYISTYVYMCVCIACSSRLGI